MVDGGTHQDEAVGQEDDGGDSDEGREEDEDDEGEQEEERSSGGLQVALPFVARPQRRLRQVVDGRLPEVAACAVHRRHGRRGHCTRGRRGVCDGGGRCCGVGCEGAGRGAGLGVECEAGSKAANKA